MKIWPFSSWFTNFMTHFRQCYKFWTTNPCTFYFPKNIIFYDTNDRPLWHASYPRPRGDNSWYPVYKRHLYPTDIRFISLISGSWIRSKQGCLQRFFKFITLTIVHWYLIKYPGITSTYPWYSTKICQIIVIGSIFSWYPFNRRLNSGWYPLYPDIRLFRFSARRYLLHASLTTTL